MKLFRYFVVHLLFLFCAGGLFFVGPSGAVKGFAQGAEDSISDEELIALLRSSQVALSERAQKLVAPFVAEGQFFIWVNVDWNLAKVRQALGEVPSEPSNANSSSNSNSDREIALPFALRSSTLRYEQLDSLVRRYVDPFVNKMVVDFYIDQSLPPSASEQVIKILSAALPVNEKRGDRIVIEKKPLGRFDLRQDFEKAAEQLRTLEGRATSAEQAASAERIQKQNVETKAAALETSKSTLSAQVDQEKRAREDLERQLEEIKAAQEKENEKPAFLRAIRSYIEGMEIPVAALIFVSLLTLAGFAWVIVGHAFRSRQAKTLSGAIESIATALGTKPSGGGGGAGGGLGSVENKSKVSVLGGNSESEGVGKGTTSQIADFPVLSSDQVLQLTNQATTLWRILDSQPLATRIILKEWIMDNQVQKVAFALAMLPPEEQFQYISSFSASERVQIVGALTRAPAAGQAAALSLQLYQEAQLYISGRPTWVANLPSADFLGIDPDSYVDLFVRLSPKASALLLYLLPKKSAIEVVRKLPGQKASEALKLLKGCAGYSQGEAIAEVAEINEQVQDQLRVERNVILDQAIAFYDAVQEEVRPSIAQGLADDKPLLDAVMKKVVSMDKIFQLDNDTLSELLEPLAPEEIALLLTGLNPDYVARVGSFLSRSAFISLQSEMTRISSKPSLLRKASLMSSQLQQELVRRVKLMERSGEIVFGESDSASPAGAGYARAG